MMMFLYWRCHWHSDCVSAGQEAQSKPIAIVSHDSGTR